MLNIIANLWGSKARHTLLLLLVIGLIASAKSSATQPKETEIDKSKNEKMLELWKANQPRFSEVPTDDEITKTRVFYPSLIPIGGKTTPQENKDLAKAMLGFVSRTRLEDVSLLEEFLSRHPSSPWKAALLTHIGLVQRQHGYFSRALKSYEAAWAESKGETNQMARLLADTAVSEFAEINGRVGRMDRMKALFAEIGDRQMTHRAGQKMVRVQEGLWMMEHTPERAFLCGPYALLNVQWKLDPSKTGTRTIADTKPSTTNGTSFAQLVKWGKEFDMELVGVERVGDAPLIVPSVIHWKLGHFAAVVEQKGDLYRIEDPTFDKPMWVSLAAIREEASGYFLIPRSQWTDSWKNLTDEKLALVWGKGSVTDVDSGATGLDDKMCNDCPPGAPASSGGPGMPYFNIHTLAASLHIRDVPLFYQPPVGPDLSLMVIYNQREDTEFQLNLFNMGPYWLLPWQSYLTTAPHPVPLPFFSDDTDVTLYKPGGGSDFFSQVEAGSPNAKNGGKIVGLGTGWQWVRSDGWIFRYQQYMPFGESYLYSKWLLTSIVDPSGNQLTIEHEDLGSAQLRIARVIDALGQTNRFTYGMTNGYDVFKPTKFSDPFGREVNFLYDTNGRLSRITDVIGLSTDFVYGGSPEVITKMITPYGTNTFELTGGGGGRTVVVTDPLGQKERLQFMGDLNGTYPSSEAASPDPSLFVNGNLCFRNSFFWDKKAMAEAANPSSPEYSKATVYHWVHGNTSGSAGAALESMKHPLEERVWYRYPGQFNATTMPSLIQPIVTARRLDDGSVETHQATYNSIGNLTSYTDPVGRVTTNRYAGNEIDLIESAQMIGTNKEILFRAGYNSQHMPLAMTNASGYVTWFAYETNGLILFITNAINQVVSFKYDANWYLTNMTDITTNRFLNFTYDSKGRVYSTTHQDGYSVTNEYDNLNRLVKVTYPDGTSEQVVYERLDPVLSKDRLNRWSATIYDALQRPVTFMDPEGRKTLLDWCACGSLSSMTDAMGRTTTWFRDLQGRPTFKRYSDDSYLAYEYERTTSRLKTLEDAKRQKTNYRYHLDGNIANITYSNTSVATPAVFFTYETNYNRLASMKDGTGTTLYSYNSISTNLPNAGAGMLASVDGPLGNDTIAYQYDSLGRATNRSIGGVSQTVFYDVIGRVGMVSNVLGSFTNTYFGDTYRLSWVSYPNGQGSVFDYETSATDIRLKTIWHTNALGATISRFDYGYDANRQITTWRQQMGTSATNEFGLEYDLADQLTAAVLRSVPGNSIVKQWVYGYDGAGNRLREQIDLTVKTSTYNDANQLMSTTAGGKLRFSGFLGETGTVSVAGSPATVTKGTNFSGYADVTAGTNKIAIIAEDVTGNRITNRYDVVISTNDLGQILTYDRTGNLLSVVSSTKTNYYTWDGLNRLIVTEVYGTNAPVKRSEFAYNGMSQRIRIVEKENGITVRDKRFVWVGGAINEERDATGTNVVKRFLGVGEQRGSTNLFYTRDHLGSVRELSDVTGALRVRYDYDSYGKRTKVEGDLECDFGFTGHYVHEPTALHLTWFRAYDCNISLWLTRDPLGEKAGLNVYSYVGNNPIKNVDPLGLQVNFGGGGNYAWQAATSGRNQVPLGQQIDTINYFMPASGIYGFAGMEYEFKHIKIEGVGIISLDGNSGINAGGLIAGEIGSFGVGYEVTGGDSGFHHGFLFLGSCGEHSGLGVYTDFEETGLFEWGSKGPSLNGVGVILNQNSIYAEVYKEKKNSVLESIANWWNRGFDKLRYDAFGGR